MGFPSQNQVSAWHRVVSAPEDRGSKGEAEGEGEGEGEGGRISLVFFSGPDNDAIVAPLPQCVGGGEAPRYPPISAREHLLQVNPPYLPLP